MILLICIITSLFLAAESLASPLHNRTRWDMPIPYFIDGACESAVLAEIAIWEKKTCLSFRRLYSRPANRNALVFQQLEGCRSYVGQVGCQPQLLSVGAGCESGDTVARLIGNSLGLRSSNESRPDTSSYTESRAQIYGSRFEDFKEVNLAYCLETCGSCLQCQNSGYPDPKNCTICRCPEGFGGSLCERAADNVARCGPGDLAAQESFQSISERGNASCHYVITAPKGKKVFFQIVSFNFSAADGCSSDYLELKIGEDMAASGMRFCDKFPLGMLTEGNQLCVIYHGRSDFSRFAIRYQSVAMSSPYGYAPPIHQRLRSKARQPVVRPFFQRIRPSRRFF